MKPDHQTFPQTVPHTYVCLGCKTARPRDLKEWIVTMFCRVCRRNTQHQRED